MVVFIMAICDTQAMGITLSHTTALEILRGARAAAGTGKLPLEPTVYLPPKLDVGQRWTLEIVNRMRKSVGIPRSGRLDVLVPAPEARVGNRLVSNHVWRAVARGTGTAFLLVEGTDVAIPGPEILLAQMAELLPLPELVALGHELCGNYSLRPSTSRAPAATGIKPVTTVTQIQQVLAGTRGLRGGPKLLQALRWIREHSLSPAETCLSTILQLPIAEFGYELEKLELNERVTPADPDDQDSTSQPTRPRVPDIRFVDTPVGLNYDGDVHVDLDAIVAAAKRLGEKPDSVALKAQLDLALKEAREDISSDKRRDRDLLAMGLLVPAVTKFDLESADELDAVVAQLLDMLERTSGWDVSAQRVALDDAALRQGRGDVLRRLSGL